MKKGNGRGEIFPSVRIWRHSNHSPGGLIARFSSEIRSQPSRRSDKAVRLSSDSAGVSVDEVLDGWKIGQKVGRVSVRINALEKSRMSATWRERGGDCSGTTFD